MEIGDLVVYLEETYVLHGIDPMSVSGRRAVLEDTRTGERRAAPFDEIEPCTEAS